MWQGLRIFRDGSLLIPFGIRDEYHNEDPETDDDAEKHHRRVSSRPFPFFVRILVFVHRQTVVSRSSLLGLSGYGARRLASSHRASISSRVICSEIGPWLPPGLDLLKPIDKTVNRFRSASSGLILRKREMFTMVKKTLPIPIPDVLSRWVMWPEPRPYRPPSHHGIPAILRPASLRPALIWPIEADA